MGDIRDARAGGAIGRLLADIRYGVRVRSSD
jgi:hypothetical protein